MPRTRTYGLDIDTVRYAQRVKSGSGTTILPEHLKQINKFVVGVKKLGLWNSMVCWPMRSIHNAGTGSTVYSLGGLGTYNGTMVNGPAWGFNWMLFNSTNAYMIQNSLPTEFKQFTIMASANTINSSSVFSVVGVGTSPTQSPTNNTYVTTTVAGNNAHLVFGNGTTLNIVTPRLGSGPRFFGVATTGSGGSIVAYQDTQQLSSSNQGTANPTLANFIIAARPHDKIGSPNVQASFGAAFSSALIESQYLAIHTLHKRTLGIGLNLP